MIRKLFEVKIAAISETDHTVTAIVSTDAIDRDDEVILPSAFEKSLPRYMRNAVHGWAHDYSKIENILGKAIDAKILPNGLQVTFKYAVDTPSGMLAWLHIKAGNISAYSVGFMPVSWVIPDEKTLPQYKGARRVYTEVDLWEIALCAVPCQPEALVVGRTADSKSEEATMSASPAASTDKKAGITKQHPLTADIAARLHAAACTVEGYSWWNDDDDNEPPDPEICQGVIPILEAIIADLQALSKSDDDTAAIEPVTTTAPHPAGKAGATMSAANKEILDNLHQCVKEAEAHCASLKDAVGMDDSAAASTEDDPEDGEGTDKSISLVP